MGKIRLRRQKKQTIRTAMAFMLGFLAGGLFVVSWIQRAVLDEEYTGSQIAYAHMGQAREGAGLEEETASEDAWNLALVNYANKMDPGYTPPLTEVESGYQVDSRAAQALKDMLADGRDAGYDIRICSAYRTWEKQESLYSNKVQEYIKTGMEEKDARTEAAKTVAVPGTSEHQLGLAADLVAEGYQILDEKQEERPEQQWLMEHCQEYGFILRYPSGKTDITGIIYEPWHYRYVGEKAAREIMDQGLCLEEYLDAQASEAVYEPGRF